MEASAAPTDALGVVWELGVHREFAWHQGKLSLCHQLQPSPPPINSVARVKIFPSLVRELFRTGSSSDG